MADTINMPKLGFDMAEGTLVRWVKKVGESINKGEVLAEIETDKATVEVESTAAGVIRLLLVEEGAVVPVNSPIAVVGTADEKVEAPQAGQTSKPEASQTSKAGEGQTLIPKVQGQGVEARAVAAAELKSAPPAEVVPAPAAGPVKASPLAKRIAREQNVELNQIRGSGPGGRIVRRDIEAVLQTADHRPETAVNVRASTVQLPSTAADEMVPLSKLRQAIARRMTDSKNSIPHFYVTHEYKMDALMDLRAKFNQIVAEDEKLSVNDFIVKAAALTLRQFPNLNASMNGISVLRHGQVNVGVAVVVEGGLLTIVCRAADQKTLRQISAEVKAMVARVRTGKVKSEDIEGSTFSISNMGMYDVENFAAIINPPEAAILAVSSARQVPVVEQAALKVGWRMKATLSVDHRVSDGVEAAKFLQALALYLEEPLRLVI